MKKFHNILKLLTWNNQSYPIGSYSFSSGLEYAVELNIVSSSKDLQYWLKDLLIFGNLQSDAILLVKAWKLSIENKDNDITSLNNFAASLSQSKEKHIESIEQGKSFIKISKDTWSHRFPSNNLMFPIAYACSAAQEGINLEDTLLSFLHSNLCNLLAAGIKLIPLGQTEGQKIQLQLNKYIEKEYENIIKRDLNLVGTCGWVNDIVSMKHESQFTRIFRT
ncbi:MAG: urease accessory UreF family protein [Pseudomonadota bacterium]|nr:urease accessory UreF family protein [Pseudomonadota bacterium]